MVLQPGMCMPLQDIPARRGWAVEDGSKMGRFTPTLASWDVISTSGDGQVLVVTADVQPARPKLRVTCGRFPTAAKEWSSPSPTSGGPTPKPAQPRAAGAHTGAAPTPYSQPSRTKPVTKAGIKAPK